MKQNFGLYILESNYSKGNLSQKSHIEYFDSTEEASDNLKFKLWKYIASRVSVTNKISETYYKRLMQLKSINSIDEFKRLRLPKYLSYSEAGERFSNANFYITKNSEFARFDFDGSSLFIKLIGTGQTELGYVESIVMHPEYTIGINVYNI